MAEEESAEVVAECETEPERVRTTGGLCTVVAKEGVDEGEGTAGAAEEERARAGALRVAPRGAKVTWGWCLHTKDAQWTPPFMAMVSEKGT